MPSTIVSSLCTLFMTGSTASCLTLTYLTLQSPLPADSWVLVFPSSACGSTMTAIKSVYRPCYEAWSVKAWVTPLAHTAVSSLITSTLSRCRLLATGGKTKWRWADVLRAYFEASTIFLSTSTRASSSTCSCRRTASSVLELIFQVLCWWRSVLQSWQSHCGFAADDHQRPRSPVLCLQKIKRKCP